MWFVTFKQYTDGPHDTQEIAEKRREIFQEIIDPWKMLKLHIEFLDQTPTIRLLKTLASDILNGEIERFQKNYKDAGEGHEIIVRNQELLKLLEC